VKDFDVERRVLTVREGKERLTVLPQSLVQKAVKLSVADAASSNAATCHNIRYSFSIQLRTRAGGHPQALGTHWTSGREHHHMIYTDVVSIGPFDVCSPTDMM
jgi:hypothetical protein